MNSVAANGLAAVGVPTSTAAGSHLGIPYRTAASVPPESFAVALTVTALVLVVLVGLLVYARRRGLLQPGRHAVDEAGVEVRATRRVSMTTSVHVIAYRGREYLLLESARGSATSVTPVEIDHPVQGKGP